MDMTKRREDALRHVNALRALYANLEAKLSVVESQSPDHKYDSDIKALNKALDAAVDQASKDNTIAPSSDSRLRVKQAVRAVDEREASYLKSSEEEWSAFEHELLQKCNSFYVELTLLQRLAPRRSNAVGLENLAGDVASWQDTADKAKGQPSGETVTQNDTQHQTDLNAPATNGVKSGQSSAVDTLTQSIQVGETPESNKRPHTEDVECPAKRLRVQRTIDFAKVYQDGKPQTNYRIVAKSCNRKPKYYIFRCQTHNIAFSSKSPLQAGSHHLRKEHEPELEKGATHKAVYKLLGIEVKQCTEELMQLNNHAIEEALKGNCTEAITTQGQHQQQQGAKPAKPAKPALSTNSRSHMMRDDTSSEKQPCWSNLNTGDGPFIESQEDGVIFLSEIVVNSSEPDEQPSDDEVVMDNADDPDWVDEQSAALPPRISPGPEAFVEPDASLANGIRDTLIVTLQLPRFPQQPDGHEMTNHEEEAHPADRLLDIKREYAVFPVPDPTAVDEAEDGNTAHHTTRSVEEHMVLDATELAQMDLARDAMEVMTANEISSSWLSSAATQNNSADVFNVGNHTTLAFSPINVAPSNDSGGSFFHYQHILGLGREPSASQVIGSHAPVAAMSSNEA